MSLTETKVFARAWRRWRKEEPPIPWADGGRACAVMLVALPLAFAAGLVAMPIVPAAALVLAADTVWHRHVTTPRTRRYMAWVQKMPKPEVDR